MTPRAMDKTGQTVTLVLIEPAVERIGFAAFVQGVQGHVVRRAAISDLQECRGALSEVRALIPITSPLQFRSLVGR